MQTTICDSCGGRKARKAWKYCTRCARHIDTLLPSKLLARYDSKSSAKYIYTYLDSHDGELIITCDISDDIEATMSRLCVDIGVTLGEPKIIKGYEFTFNVNVNYIEPVEIKDDEFEFKYNVDRDLMIGNMVVKTRYERYYNIIIRELQPAKS